MRKLMTVVLLAGVVMTLWSSRGVMGGAQNGNAGEGEVRAGDVNGDGGIDIADAVYIANWMFTGGPPPVAVARSCDAGVDDCGYLTCMEGTWIAPGGFLQTIVVGHDGQSLQIWGRSISLGDSTLGGQFPDAVPADSLVHGAGKRIGSDLWKFRLLGHALNEVDGERTGIAYMQIIEGTLSFPDCETHLATLSRYIYLPEQDKDGDGFPDADEDPAITVFEDIGPLTVKKLSV